MEVIVFMLAAAGGLCQGIAGFGAGIIMMMAFPAFFTIPQSAGISGAISLILCAMLAFRYHHYVKFKNIFLPSLLCIVVSIITVNYSVTVNEEVLRKIFGVFLLMLCIYYLFINERRKVESAKMSLPIAVLCIFTASICDGLFGIGGPLSVFYFLSVTNSKQEYLGTIQLFFLIKLICLTAFRLYKGILITSYIPVVGIGMLGILIGGFIANRLVDRLDGNKIKKFTYVMIGVSGLLNIF